jgi:hypothetical protein
VTFEARRIDLPGKFISEVLPDLPEDLRDAAQQTLEGGITSPTERV